jgi:hypothetical protein
LINELKCTKDIEQLKITQLAKVSCCFKSYFFSINNRIYSKIKYNYYFKLDAIFSVERSSADIARSELAGVVAQQESIENQVIKYDYFNYEK